MEPAQIHPMATGHIPHYIAAADGSDYLFNVMIGFLVIAVVLLGLVYFSLHALPEKMAHRSNHPQFQLVGILALLALFTHNNVYWVAAILVAGFQIPDLGAPFRAIAEAILKLAPKPDPARTTAAPEGAYGSDTSSKEQ